MYSIPDAWLQPVKMDRVILHWTAGAWRASAHDKECYHILVEHDGNVVKGDHDIADNVNVADDDYAAHTRALNTRSIGVSMTCMAGADESPFNAGRYPLTQEQWERAAEVVAHLCLFYKIDVTPRTVLTHAEVQGTLGVKQAGKWDVTRLPWDPTTKGATPCGNKFRALVKGFM